MGIGIMHGRLSPPEDGLFQSFPTGSWEAEFGRAREAGLEAIEWIFDLRGEAVNPISTDAGIDRIRALADEFEVAVRSVCADYFMDRPLLRCGTVEREAGLVKLRWLLGRCAGAGIGRVVLPFVDASSMTSAEERDAVSLLLLSLRPALEQTGVEIHLETSLDPASFAAFLDTLPDPCFRVNYDSGNSASLGYSPRDEFGAYGARVGSVHVKDRVLGGGTVPLGRGDADFLGLLEGLRRTEYAGDFILQAARGESGGEVELAKHNRAFVESWLGTFGPGR